MTKVESAQAIIRDAVEKHGHRAFVSYSGGKDSRVLLHLVASVCPRVLVVHNAHPGEDKPEEFGFLVTVPPKREVIPQLLEACELSVSLDGSRRAEDKPIMINGKEVPRSEMAGPIVHGGHYGLLTVCPMWDWEDEDVWHYLEAVADAG
jgi:3'-phosphoadenosine 5'-phosphosulfate sulfotransferase (PAPS reductase)/FAD synthetase